MSRQDLLKELSIRDDEREEGSSLGKWIAIGVVVLVLAGTAAWWFLRGGKVVSVSVVSVLPAQASGGNAGSVLDASGYVVARRQATVSAKTTGKVKEVLIQEGMRVEAGQLLATLDSSNSTAQLDLAQAQAQSSRQRVVEARVQLADAERQLKRNRDLMARKLVSQAALDTAQATADGLKARIQSSMAEINVAERTVAVYQQQQVDNEIRAPFAGIVIAKAAQPGEMISPISAGGGFTRSGIATIVDMESLEVEVDVGESFINRVLPEMSTEITLNAYPDWKIPGSVIAIIPTADRTKATVKVRVAFIKKDGRVLPDMGARVRFISVEPAAGAAIAAPVLKGVLVPSSAVLRGKVFVVKDGVIEERDISIAETIGANARIENNLAIGEQIVTENLDQLKSGTQVSVQ